ncbi:hypothetical protein ABER61_14345 [Brevibacillus formosus]|uniref:Uncharacterized protein n=1 Tax=Brevibacillus formosus TaxID=54913 RepID=A0A837KUL5_9BACL|nr:hypothetical protein [Brevibacillus formosus]KLI00672.1 hypothetical protein AA984_01825 [Brevibacillus formosus]MED1956348.1 hypothetical protein [Brevibacillus formosus]PSK00653.1 hypothetical protein C7R91_03195 [Brevibacillus formosus]GED58075.1 hypothetical protein BFO01nite_22070 [Brevibacillus formosus]
MDYLLRFPSKSGVPLRLPQSVITILPQRNLQEDFFMEDKQRISLLLLKPLLGLANLAGV